MNTLSRRTFLRGLAAAPVVAAAGCALGQSSSTPAATGLRPLPLPPLAESVVDASGVRQFALVAAPGSSPMLAGKSTATWGYNGGQLGPTIRARRGEQVAFTIQNALPEPTSVHWHGMHVPAEFDGGPHQTIEAGATWKPTWTVKQPAATLWYHPHPHGSTEKHVYRGLAGMFIVDDDESDALRLPNSYGVDDFPVIVADRRFTSDGELDDTDPTDVGLLGDTIVTNGLAGAYLSATTDLVRLRLLNGSSGRLYNFGFSDDRDFTLIASDGGLLAAPFAANRIQLSPGERIEIVVAMRSGETTMLRSYPIDRFGGVEQSDAAAYGLTDSFDILELRSAARLVGSLPLPATLATIDAPNSAAAVVNREFVLQWFMINGVRMDMNRIDFTPTVDTTEVWTVHNKDNWPHNFHVHDTQFQILDIDGSPPPPALAGWKDTVYTPPGQRIRLLLRFSEYTDPTFPYMYHCHLLLHEDKGMMGQFLVLAPGQKAAPMTMDMPMDMDMPGMSGMHH